MGPSVQESKRSLQQIKSKVLDEVLDSELSELTHLKWLIHSALKIAVMVGRDFFQNLVKLQAMALAFKTLLSIAPFLAVVFSILKGFGVHNRMEPALAEALAPLGEKGQEITTHLIGFVDKMSAGALGSIGFVTLFITVVVVDGHDRGVVQPHLAGHGATEVGAAVQRLFERHSRRTGAGFRRGNDYGDSAENNAIVHALFVAASARYRHSGVASVGAVSDSLGRFHFRLRLHTEYARQDSLQRWSAAWWPRSFGRRWAGGSPCLSLRPRVITAIYSSFAILLLFLLWLAHRLGDRALGRASELRASTCAFLPRRPGAIGAEPAGREKLVLHMMLLIGRNFYHGLDPMSISDLAARLRLPAGMVKEFLEMFAQTKLVLPLADEETFVLGRDPETISIKEILDCVRNSGKRLKAPTERQRGRKRNQRAAARHRAIDGRSFAGKNLQGLILTLSPPETRR